MTPRAFAARVSHIRTARARQDYAPAKTSWQEILPHGRVAAGVPNMTTPRISLRLFLLLSFAAVTSCAEGAPAFSGAPTVDAGGGTSPMPRCGDGIVDSTVGETCDCKNLSVGTCLVNDPTQTCQSLMNDTQGTLLCDAQTCMFNVTMCHSTMPDAGGGGAGG
jgi:hypothetical protein